MVELVDAPVGVGAVRIHGANATSRAFLGWLIAPHLAVPPHTTFRDVLDSTAAISRTFAASGLFRAHSVRIQPADDGDTGHVDLVYTVHERGRFFIKTATELGDGEGTAASNPSRLLPRTHPPAVPRGPPHQPLWPRRRPLPQRLPRHQDQARV